MSPRPGLRASRALLLRDLGYLLVGYGLVALALGALLLPIDVPWR